MRPHLRGPRRVYRMGYLGFVRLPPLPLLRQRLRDERLAVQTEPEIVSGGHVLVREALVRLSLPPHAEFQLYLRAAIPPVRAVEAGLVGAQVDLVLEDHEPRGQALRLVTQKVLPVEMPFEAIVVLEELVGLPLLLANVTLVMLLVQVLVQRHDVVESQRLAEFAERVAREAAQFAVSVGLVPLETLGGVACEFGDEVAFVRHAQVADRVAVIDAEVCFESLQARQSFFHAALLLLVGLLFPLVVDGGAYVSLDGIPLVHVGIAPVGELAIWHAASVPQERHHVFLVQFVGKVHADVFPVDVSITQIVPPELILIESLVMH
mmetsp:Transcript_1460/g.3109  ORF Transcript_1460/g.3109 Transcript_1460/m.3109 type:complete len:321 (+) Transcript_1460:1382-2344(+)